MTQEVQNEIINQFWGIVPTILIFIVGAALLGIGYKLIEKKLLQKKNKKSKAEPKEHQSRK